MQKETLALLSGSLGTRRSLSVLRFGNKGASPKVYIQAAVHADEVPALLVSAHLRRRLATLESLGRISGEVVLVPFANPIGLGQHIARHHLGRYDMRTNENFNNKFPDLAPLVSKVISTQLTDNEGANKTIIRSAMHGALSGLRPSTELGSMRLCLMRLAYDADVVLDLHTDWDAVPHLYTGAPVWDEVKPLASYLGARVTLLSLKSGDNPFDDACGQTWWKLRDIFGGRHPIPHGTTAVTVEHRGVGDVSHEYASKDAEAIIKYLVQKGVILGEPPAVQDSGIVANLSDVGYVTAPTSGVIVYRKQPGDLVSRGSLIAEIIDPSVSRVTVARSPVAGMLYARNVEHFATRGMTIARVAVKQKI